MEYYVKPICTKTYFFTSPCDCHNKFYDSFTPKKKRCFTVRWNWYTQFHRLDSHFKRFFLDFHHPGASWGFLSCGLYFLVFPWLSYLLPKTTMEILWKYKINGEKVMTLLVGYTFIGFCTSVFPNKNLMPSQRPIFRASGILLCCDFAQLTSNRNFLHNSSKIT